MDAQKAKDCLLTSFPVKCNGICYDSISAIIYRRDSSTGKIAVSVELLDKNNNSVTIANVESAQICNTTDK